MVSKVRPGQSVLERMAVYRRLVGLGALTAGYASKFALAAFVGVMMPLGAFVLYPAQGQRSNAMRCWNWFQPQDQKRGAGEPALLAAIALVTDMDAGVSSGEGVGQDEVFAMFADNIERLKTVLTGVIGDLPDPAGCSCSTWADGLDLTYDVP